MRTYEVEVEQTEIRSYIWTIEAESEEDAESRYHEGDVGDGDFIDAIDTEVVCVVCLDDES